MSLLAIKHLLLLEFENAAISKLSFKVKISDVCIRKKSRLSKVKII
jgi:hypothetical protein